MSVAMLLTEIINSYRREVPMLPITKEVHAHGRDGKPRCHTSAKVTTTTWFERVTCGNCIRIVKAARARIKAGTDALREATGNAWQTWTTE